MTVQRNRDGEYARRKAKCLQFNLCFGCLQPKGQNKWKCTSCLERDNARDRARRIARASQNLCDCGQPVVPGFRVCPKCREEDRLCQEIKRNRNRQLGLCFCGNQPKPCQVTCGDCQRRATLSTMRRYRDNIAAQRCAFCSNELNQSTFRCNSCHEQHIIRGQRYWSEKRLLVIDHYGGGCQCCGLTTPEFLDVDHINNNGMAHRLETGRHFCEWVIKNNYPSDLRLLCSNCNQGRTKFDVCPHHQEPALPQDIRRQRRRRRRIETIGHYGGQCKCCGESNWAFLEFDHINNDGNLHHKETGHRPDKLVAWLIANNYPDTIQLLCSNCNKAKGLYGTCPHFVLQHV